MLGKLSHALCEEESIRTEAAITTKTHFLGRCAHWLRPEEALPKRVVHGRQGRVKIRGYWVLVEKLLENSPLLSNSGPGVISTASP